MLASLPAGAIPTEVHSASVVWRAPPPGTAAGPLHTFSLRRIWVGATYALRGSGGANEQQQQALGLHLPSRLPSLPSRPLAVVAAVVPAWVLAATAGLTCLLLLHSICE